MNRKLELFIFGACGLLEQRSVKFSPDEQQLYELTFHNFKPRDFLKLLKLGEWKKAGRGDKILTRGDTIEEILVPITGRVCARQGKEQAVQLVPGELIGAGVALTGQPSAFDAEFSEDARYMIWSMTDINRFLDRNPELGRKFNDVVNRYLITQINKLAICLSGSDHRTEEIYNAG